MRAWFLTCARPATWRQAQASTQEQFTFPRLDIRCAMAQSYRIVRSKYCYSSPRQYQYLTAKPVS